MKAIICFVASALLSAALSSLSSACLFGGSDCQCPVTPDQPARQAALPIDEAMSFDQTGNEGQLPTVPLGGTLDIAGDELFIRYADQGSMREVIYTIGKPAFLRGE